MRTKLYFLLNMLALIGLVAGLLPPAPATATRTRGAELTNRADLASEGSPGAEARIRSAPRRSVAASVAGRHAQRAPGMAPTDLNGDHAVDGADLRVLAGAWNCAAGAACFDAAFDSDADGDIDALDLAAVGNEYDVSPPALAITQPGGGAAVGGASLLVTGVVSDAHAIAAVTVNGVTATLGAGAFAATVPITPGNLSLHVAAADAIGLTSSDSRVLFVDQEGPFVTVNVPEHRQSIYTLRPSIAISYSDFYTGVNLATLQVTLADASGVIANLTNGLVRGPGGATGSLSFNLTGDRTYTVTASLADTLGNVGRGHSSFFVPPDAGAIKPPAEPPEAGWVSGVVYDFRTCDTGLLNCDGLAGARVTLAQVDESALAAARDVRDRQLAAAGGDTTPMAAGAVAPFTTPLTGTIVTGPDGFFAFPAGATDRYIVRVEKAGYTYGQRSAEIVRERSTATNEIYLTPIDPASTPCDDDGCSHQSADGQMQVEIPPGALPAGEEIDVTATEFDRVVYLPSGELPPGTQETYAFNLSGASEVTFAEPVTVRIKNSRGFAPGTQIPLGFWNQQLFQWEHAGLGTITPDGVWVEMQVTHFSTYDCNDPVTSNDGEVGIDDETGEDGDDCASDDCASEIALRSGALRQQVTLPEVQVLGEAVAPMMTYDSGRANPAEIIDLELDFQPEPGVQLGDTIQAELFIEGEKTETFTVPTPDLEAGGEIGRFRVQWDGRDSQDRRLPPGVYRYAVRLRVPYRAEFFMSLNGRFGGPPDLTRPTGVFSNATLDETFVGSVTLDSDPGGPFGMGWALAGQQRLFEDEVGNILIDDGDNGVTEYSFPAKNLLGPESPATAFGRVATSALPAAAPSPEDEAAESSPPAVVRDAETARRIAESAAPVLGDALPAAAAVAQPPAPPVESAVLAEPATEATAAAALQPVASVPLPPPAVYEFGPQSVVVSGAIITHTTWTVADSPYIMNGDVAVTAGITLTIQPGVVVKGFDDVELRVHGHLEARGLATSPITLTSNADTAGGQWSGLVFDGGSGLLRHATVRFGGDNNSLGRNGNVLARDSERGLRIENSRVLTTNDFSSTEDYGLYLENSRAVVGNTQFSGIGNTSRSRVLALVGPRAALELSDVTLANNIGAPLRIDAESLHGLRLASTTFGSHTENHAFVTGTTVSQTATLLRLPGVDGYEIGNDVTVTAGVTLVVEPGVTLRAPGDAELRVLGRLEALGTATQPITFTSRTDTGLNQWSGLVFDGGSGRLNHATVRFGGNNTSLGTTRGNIAVRNGTLTVENSVVRDEQGAFSTPPDSGIYVENSSVTVSDTLFTNNALGDGNSNAVIRAIGADTVLRITGSTFEGNGAPLRLGADLLHQLHLAGNTFRNNSPNLVVLDAGAIAASTTLRNNPGLRGYELASDVVISPTVTVRLERGQAVMGRPETELRVLGRLEALGTATEPITFTSRTDTGLNQWSGLVFDGGSGLLRHATVRYAGNTTSLPATRGNIAVRNGTLTVENSAVRDEQGAFSTPPDSGIYVENSSVTVSDTLFTNNALGDGNSNAVIRAIGAASVLRITGSTFEGNGAPLRLGADLLHQLHLAGNTFRNNSPNLVVLDAGTIAASTTLRNNPGLRGYELASDVVISPTVTVRLERGQAVMGRPETELRVLGRLEALGTATEPITFTSRTDTGLNQWSGLVFDGGSGLLRHATVRYAGNTTSLPATRGNIAVRNGTLTVENSVVRDEQGAFSTPPDSGIYVENSSVTVSDTLFTNNALGDGNSNAAIRVEGAGNELRVVDSIFDGNGPPMRLPVAAMQDINLEGNTFANNTPNRVLLRGGELGGDTVFVAQAGLEGYQVEREQDVIAPPTTMLTVEPGVTVFAEGGELLIRGHLRAVGTAAQPIIFTSRVNTGPAQWTGLIFDGGSGHLRHATVRYGALDSSLGINERANIIVRDVLTGEVRIETSQIRDMQGPGRRTGYGLFVQNSRVTVTDTLFVNNGNDDGENFALFATGDQTVLNVSGSTFERNEHAMHVPLAMLPNVRNNIFLGNTSNLIQLGGGMLAADTTLKAQTGLEGYVLADTVTVTNGVTLTVEPNLRVLGGRDKHLIIRGRLLAIGSATERITFASQIPSLPWLGMVLEGGEARLEFADVRQTHVGITLNSGRLDLRGASLVGNFRTGVHLVRSQTRLAALEAQTSFTSVGSDFSGYTGTFRNNGIRNDTGQVVDARFNFWGSILGPFHPTLNPNGTGSRVSDNVLFDPWLDAPIDSVGVTSQTATDETTLTFDPASQTYTRHYPDATTAHFTPDGRHDFTQSPLGTRIAYTYNPDGSTASMRITAAGEQAPRWVWTFAYTGGRLASITDPAGRVTRFTVDGRGDLSAVQQAGLSAPMTYIYDTAHRMTQKQDARGFITTYEYDADGRMARTLLPPRPIFDPATGLLRTEQEIHTYAPSDGAGVVTGTTKPPAVGAPLIKRDALREAVSIGTNTFTGQTSKFGSPVEATDALSRTVHYERDERDRITRAVQPDGACIEFTYDEQDNVLSMIGMPAAQCALPPAQRDPAQSQLTLSTYEARFNQLKTSTDPLGRVITYTYDYEVDQGQPGAPRALLVQITYPPVPDEDGVEVTPVATFAYNRFGQTTRENNLRDIAICYAYTEGTAAEAANGATPRFLPGVTPVPGLLVEVREDCGGPDEKITAYGDFDGAGNPHLVTLPQTSSVRQFRQTFDARNRLSSVTDAVGVVTLYDYDNADNLVRMIEDAGGRDITTGYDYDAASLLLSERTEIEGQTIEFRYGYDLNRNLTMEQDATGNITRYFYDAADQLVRQSDAAGHSTHYSYDANGRVVEERYPNGMLLRFVYDAFSRVVQEIEDAGGLNLVTTTEYDLANNAIVRTDAAGVRFCYSYDSHDRLIAETRDCGPAPALNATIRMRYDLNGNQVATVDALGRTTRYGYDHLDRQVAITDALGNTTATTYDAAGNEITVTDELGRVSSSRYDAANRLTVTTDPLGNVTTYTYDRIGNITAMTDPLGRVSTYEYDDLARRTQTTNPAGGVTRYAYDPNSNLVSQTDPLGRTTGYLYDVLNRRTTVIDPAGGVTSYAYDGMDNLLAVTDELGRSTRYVYDRLNRQTAMTDALGNVTSFTYDVRGNLSSRREPAGEVTRYDYDALSRRTAITDALGAVTRMDYDLFGNRLTLTDPNDNTTSFTYDALNRVLAETNGAQSARRFTYDGAGNIIAMTDRNGRLHRYAYDGLNRLVSETWTGDGQLITFTYDADSQMVGAADRDSVYSYEYDALGRMTTASNAGTPGAPGVVLNYSHDAFSNVRSISEIVAGQELGTTEYSYDARNRMTTITQGGPGVAPKRVDLTYDPAGQLRALQRFRDLAGTQAVGATAHAFDAASRLTGITQTPVSGQPRQHTWAYDGNDRVTAMTSPDGSSAISYDARSQVIAADHTFAGNPLGAAPPDEGYTYDLAGNRTGGGRVVGPANRLTADGVFTYTYDAEGNRTQRRANATGAVTEYRWDFRNRLTQVTEKSGAGAVTRVVSFTYDVFNRRIATAVDPDGSGPAAARVERFVYDGLHIALTFAQGAPGTGSLTNRYLYGPALDMILADEAPARQPAVLWPLVDGQGTVRDLLDSTGALQNHLVYDSFGRIVAESNPAVDHRFSYTGRERDEATGLYYYRSRYYDPATGQFISEDPIGFAAGDTNLYRYVENSPLNYSDPMGHKKSNKDVGWFDRLDRFSAGFADALTFGLSTRAREAMYGGEATKNHQGAEFTAGQVAGTGVQLAVGLGGPAQAIKGKQLIEAGKQATKRANQHLQAAKGLSHGTTRAAQKAARQQSRRAAAQLRRGKRTFRDGFRLRRSGAVANAYNVTSAITGVGVFAGKAAGYDPCDPLSWEDALLLLPLIPVLRGGGGKGGNAPDAPSSQRPPSQPPAKDTVPNTPPSRPLSPADQKAQSIGFDDAKDLEDTIRRMNQRNLAKREQEVINDIHTKRHNQVNEAERAGRISREQADGLRKEMDMAAANERAGGTALNETNWDDAIDHANFQHKANQAAQRQSGGSTSGVKSNPSDDLDDSFFGGNGAAGLPEPQFNSFDGSTLPDDFPISGLGN